MILLAGGAGIRLGGSGAGKALLPIAGTPMLAFSLEAAAASGAVDLAVVVAPEAQVEEARRLAEGVPGPPLHAVVAGGPTRQASVRRGLAAAPAAAEVIVCHDAARPFAPPGLFRRVAQATRDADGAVPVVPSPDTVKRMRGSRVVETIPRAEIGLAQTPQAFVAAALRGAHADAESRGEDDATDDAVLVEAAGGRVVVVEGDAGNFKITTREDLQRAEGVARILRARA